jgi:hypothetical protein
LKATRLYDLLKNERQPDYAAIVGKTTKFGWAKATKASAYVTDGLKMEKFPIKAGYHVATPEQLLTLKVPTQRIEGGEIKGFQRPFNSKRARHIGLAMLEGNLMPTIEIALHGNTAWLVEGQHRAGGAVMAREPLPTLSRHMTEDEMRTLFAQQAKASAVNPSVLVLSADDPFSEYIQDAVTDDAHAWAPLVSAQTSPKDKINASQGRGVLAAYVTNTLASGSHKLELGHAEFSEQRALDLGQMLLSFGGKAENPLPYRSTNLRALTNVAVRVIIRHEHESRDAIRRWNEHMRKFPFAAHAAVTSTQDMVPVLLGHWNKRLTPDRRVGMED